MGPCTRLRIVRGALLTLAIFATGAASAETTPTIRLFPTTVVEDLRQTSSVAQEMETGLQEVIGRLDQQQQLYLESKCEGAEDDPGCRRLAKQIGATYLDMLGIIVTSLGAEFIRALSAEEAREIIADKGLPDLIFCDIMMPGESGYDFVHWLKGRYPDATVYFITGISQDDIDKIEIAKVLQKPFSAKAVMKIMKNLK